MNLTPDSHFIKKRFLLEFIGDDLILLFFIITFPKYSLPIFFILFNSNVSSLLFFSSILL